MFVVPEVSPQWQGESEKRKEIQTRAAFSCVLLEGSEGCVWFRGYPGIQMPLGGKGRAEDLGGILSQVSIVMKQTNTNNLGSKGFLLFYNSEA